MKVYLDDERPVPNGWVGVHWPSEAIELLKTERVTDLSLDHDLGDDSIGTGYDVIRWIEEQVVTAGFAPPNITIHSANPAARLRMALGVASIARLSARGSVD